MVKVQNSTSLFNINNNKKKDLPGHTTPSGTRHPPPFLTQVPQQCTHTHTPHKNVTGSMATTNHPPKLKRNDTQMAHLPTPLTADAGTWSSLTDSDKLFIPSQSEFVESSIPQSPQIGLWLCAFPMALTPEPYRGYVNDTSEAWSVSASAPEDDRNGGMFTLLATNCLHSHPTNLLPTVIELSNDVAQVRTVCKSSFSNMNKDCRMIISIMALTKDSNILYKINIICYML